MVNCFLHRAMDASDQRVARKAVDSVSLEDIIWYDQYRFEPSFQSWMGRLGVISCAPKYLSYDRWICLSDNLLYRQDEYTLHNLITTACYLPIENGFRCNYFHLIEKTWALNMIMHLDNVFIYKLSLLKLFYRILKLEVGYQLEHSSCSYIKQWLIGSVCFNQFVICT